MVKPDEIVPVAEPLAALVPSLAEVRLARRVEQMAVALVVPPLVVEALWSLVELALDQH